MFINIGLAYPSMQTTETKLLSKRTARIGVFTAVALAGSFISLPSPVSSVALDSASGYFCSLYYGPQEGFFVFMLGHILTAAVHGFPLGVLHLPIALGLGVQGYLMAKLKRLRSIGPLGSTAFGVVFNTLLAFIAEPIYGVGFVVVLLPYLAVASTVNALLAYAAYRASSKLFAQA